MKKYLIIFLLIFLCVGCKANYNITINNDLSVEESIVGLENEAFYDRYYKSTKERVIDFVSYTAKDYLEKNNYTRKIVYSENYTGLRVTKKYDNIKDYFKTSKAYNQLYDKWETSIKGNTVKISLKNKLPRNENSVDKYIIDECDVAISLPFVVKKHNADTYNKETNTYRWNLKTDEDKNIYIEFDKSKEIGDFYIDNVAAIVLGSLLFVVLIFILICFKKKKLSNKI